MNLKISICSSVRANLLYPFQCETPYINGKKNVSKKLLLSLNLKKLSPPKKKLRGKFSTPIPSPNHPQTGWDSFLCFRLGLNSLRLPESCVI